MVSEVEMRDEVQMIPISAITVENPRERSEKTFRALVDSIGKVGLKKPITVARVDEEAGVSYRLVCGQGRMEAYVWRGGRSRWRTRWRRSASPRPSSNRAPSARSRRKIAPGVSFLRTSSTTMQKRRGRRPRPSKASTGMSRVIVISWRRHHHQPQLRRMGRSLR